MDEHSNPAPLKHGCVHSVMLPGHLPTRQVLQMVAGTLAPDLGIQQQQVGGQRLALLGP